MTDVTQTALNALNQHQDHHGHHHDHDHDVCETSLLFQKVISEM
ncbi:hypothetical protein JCM19238_5027 [Vibrio ponticus]|nr:hypothetical protein JCM19238_5027 [Vibrio ponticus]